MPRLTPFDLTGERYGRLTVEALDTKPKVHGQYWWRCLCDCGGTTLATRNALKKGEKVSCGCRRHELAAPRPRPVFACECGDHVWTVLTQGFITLVSPEDAHLLERNAWSAKTDTRRVFYAGARVEGRTVKLHRLIIDGERIDHRSGNGLDNRRGNLRPATAAQNAMNSRVAITKKNISKYKGVHFRNGRWVARIKAGHVGQYNCETRAALAYNAAAKAAFGEFARLNCLRASTPLTKVVPYEHR